jgi:tripartite ATP-independent transporter DctP family solute receptor
MRRNRVLLSISIAFLSACILSVVGIGVSASYGQEGLKIEIPYIKKTKHVLRLAHGGPPLVDAPFHKSHLLFADLVEAYTRGEVRVEIYPASQLGTETVTSKMVQLGTLDMATLSVNNATQWYPPLNVYVMPFIFRNREHANKIVFGPVGKELEEGYLKASGIRMLTYLEWGDRCPLNKVRPINIPSDFKGIKMRTPKNPVMIDTYNALGATSTAISWGELYSALQQGLADGVEGPPKGLHDVKFTEVLKYYSYIPVFYGLMPIVINEKIFQSMSTENQNAILVAAKEAGAYQRWLSVKEHRNGLEIIAKAGVKVNLVKDRQPFVEKAKPIWEKYRKKIGDEWFDKIINAQ